MAVAKYLSDQGIQMAIDVYALARQAEHSITGKRWCSQCQMSKETGGGNYKEFNGGKSRRLSLIHI